MNEPPTGGWSMQLEAPLLMWLPYFKHITAAIGEEAREKLAGIETGKYFTIFTWL